MSIPVVPNVITEILGVYGFQYAVQQHLVHLLNHFHLIVKFISRLWLYVVSVVA